MQAYSLEKITKQLELEMIELKHIVDKLRYDYSIVVRHRGMKTLLDITAFCIQEREVLTRAAGRITGHGAHPLETKDQRN